MTPTSPSRHPSASVPDRLFSDDELEKRWRARFSSVRMSLPDPARDAPDRAVYISNASGRYELYCWDVMTDEHVKATDRADGTTHGDLSADGGSLLWFDDSDGDEFGGWRRQEFGRPPGSAQPALADVPPGYPAGLETGRGVLVAGFSDDEGTRIYLRDGPETHLVYQNTADGGVDGLSRDDTVWLLAHSEHGDARYPALRAISVADGSILGELDDTPGRGLSAAAFSPVPGDLRVLVGHERRGRDELLIWDIRSGLVEEMPIDLPGDLSGDFFPDGSALLILHTRHGRTSLHRFDLSSGSLTELPAAPGSVAGAVARADGAVWYRWSSSAAAPQLRVLTPDGVDGPLLTPAGGVAPGSEPLTDLWVDGPGGRIHVLLATPVEVPTTGPLPTVFILHGGPADADHDTYDAERAAWLDAGFAVAHVNYRGSTGYGSAWRDALTQRVGHTELTDVAAVHDHLIAAGVVDARRSVVAGYSWGGFLTLLALGTQPNRWAAGLAGVPVADYVQAYEDEMEPLRAYDRAIFGGSPEDEPAAYRDSSPLTYVDQVQAPVLILAGENDPRCPIRQIDTYLDALGAAGATYAQYRYEAGHGSMVVEERTRQVACGIAFARDALGLPNN